MMRGIIRFAGWAVFVGAYNDAEDGDADVAGLEDAFQEPFFVPADADESDMAYSLGPRSFVDAAYARSITRRLALYDRLAQDGWAGSIIEPDSATRGLIEAHVRRWKGHDIVVRSECMLVSSETRAALGKEGAPACSCKEVRDLRRPDGLQFVDWVALGTDGDEAEVLRSIQQADVRTRRFVLFGDAPNPEAQLLLQSMGYKRSGWGGNRRLVVPVKFGSQAWDLSLGDGAVPYHSAYRLCQNHSIDGETCAETIVDFLRQSQHVRDFGKQGLFVYERATSASAHVRWESTRAPQQHVQPEPPVLQHRQARRHSESARPEPSFAAFRSWPTVAHLDCQVILTAFLFWMCTIL